MAAYEFLSNIISDISSYNNVNLNPVAGYTPTKFDLLVGRYGFFDNGGDATETANRATWALTGYTGVNTTKVSVSNSLTQRVYFKGTIVGADYVINGWTDVAMTAAKVCEGTETGNNGGTVTLAESGSSGLSGSVVLTTVAANDSWFVDVVIYHDRYDGNVDYASLNIIGFLVLEDLDDSTLKVWKVAQSGFIVDYDNLLTAAGIDNVADVFKRNTLRDQLRLRGWQS